MRPESGDKTPKIKKVKKPPLIGPNRSGLSLREVGKILAIPPDTKVISASTKLSGRLKQNTIELETKLSPEELQVYYTDLLLKKWIIRRDTLTDGVGWNGVFMQIEGKQRRLGVFAVVDRLTAAGARPVTRVSVLGVDEL